jgi:hypothetical protein
MDKSKNTELLKEKIKEIDGLLENIDWGLLRQWREETLMILDNLIDEDSKYYQNFEKISFRSSVITRGRPDINKKRHEEAMKSGLEKAKSSLQAIIFGLEKGLF